MQDGAALNTEREREGEIGGGGREKDEWRREKADLQNKYVEIDGTYLITSELSLE